MYLLMWYLYHVNNYIEIWFNLYDLGMIQIKNTSRWGV